MRRRLYYILRDVEMTTKAVNELLLARIDDRHIHILSNNETDLANLPRANIFQKTDIIHGMELGLLVGGLTGAIAGLVFTLIPGLGNIATSGLILATTLAGALIGTWTSSMIGISARNTQLAHFEQEIEQGKILMMVDVPKAKIKEITHLIKSHYPDAHAEGIEPTIPAFP